MCNIKPVPPAYQTVLTKALKVVEQVQDFIFLFIIYVRYCYQFFSEQYILTLYRTLFGTHGIREKQFIKTGSPITLQSFPFCIADSTDMRWLWMAMDVHGWLDMAMDGWRWLWMAGDGYG